MKKNVTPTLNKTNRKLAREWHRVKNAPLTPKDVTAGSDKKVWWLCDKGHEWEAVISNRSYGTDCPFCAGERVSSDNCLQMIDEMIESVRKGVNFILYNAEKNML